MEIQAVFIDGVLKGNSLTMKYKPKISIPCYNSEQTDYFECFRNEGKGIVLYSTTGNPIDVIKAMGFSPFTVELKRLTPLINKHREG